MVSSQTRLQEISAEITRVSRSELEPLKERCRKAEFEIVSLLRRVQEAQEGANRVPELERELKIAKERIEKLELRRANDRNPPAINESAGRTPGEARIPAPVHFAAPGIREFCTKSP